MEQGGTSGRTARHQEALLLSLVGELAADLEFEFRDRARAAGDPWDPRHYVELVGELVRYENSYRLCYIRGPEGIIIELAEKLG
jgi:hypothetical protein